MSSDGGSCSCGNRSRSRRTVSIVSSTDSVVCESHTTFDGSRTSTTSACVGRVHDRDVLGRLAGGALDLFVALVADEQDLVVVAGEAHGLAVHLRHERARRVDRLQTAIGCRVHDGRRHPVRAEHDVRTRRHLVDLVDEDRALLLELGHDVDVVHDLLAHVHGRAVALERLLDGDDGAVDAGAVAPRRRQEHPLGSVDGDILERFAPPRNARERACSRRSCPRCWCSLLDSTGGPLSAGRPRPARRRAREDRMTTFQPEAAPGEAPPPDSVRPRDSTPQAPTSVSRLNETIRGLRVELGLGVGRGRDHDVEPPRRQRLRPPEGPQRPTR